MGASLQRHLGSPENVCYTTNSGNHPGPFIFEDFITEEEEARILQELDKSIKCVEK
jgi:hypothetical protein